MDNCLFCKIINKEISSYTLYEDNDVLVFLDVNPFANGHTLVIPKKHYKDAFDIPSDEVLKIFEVAKKIAKLLKEKLNYDGIKFTQNNGSLQGVMHYHLHLIPSYKNEEKLSVEEVYNILKK